MRINTIRERFNKRASHYEQLAKIQKIAAKKLCLHLLNTVPKFKPASILDLACGTGFVTEYLVNYFPNAHYHLNDLAIEMLNICKKKYTNHHCTYLLGDMENISLPNTDLIISNFSLQWSNDIHAFIKMLYQHTHHVLAFTCLIEGSFKEWQDKFPEQKLMLYPHEEELTLLIKNLNPHAYIFKESFPIQPKLPLEFMKYLQQIGVSTSLENIPIKILRQVLSSADTVKTEYHVLFAILEKNK